MPSALVNGATGLVGSHIVERLVRDGWTVRALVRDAARARWLETIGAELVSGDMSDRASFIAAGRGCDVVFHTAALIAPAGGEPWERFLTINVEGTRNAIAAAASSGARLLHLSSVAVYGPNRRHAPRPTDETTPLEPLAPRQFYARSKRESERLVLDAHAAGAVWATAVRPDVIYGARDRQFTPRIAQRFTRGPVPLVYGGRCTLPIVHAANVADGAVRAVMSDIAGGRTYNLANDFDVTAADFIRLAEIGLGQRIRVVHVPAFVAKTGARAVAGAMRAVGAKALAGRLTQAVGFLSLGNPFTSDRARREVGWSPPVHPTVGIPESFRWWKSNLP